MYAGWEPEVVDWDKAGVCSYVNYKDEETCGRPYGDRPGARCMRKSEHRCNARHGGAVKRCDLRKSDCQRIAQDEREQRLGVVPDKMKLTATDVMKAIRHRHRNPPSRLPEWLVMSEFDLGGRRADALALRLWTTRGFELHAYEIKVSRTDLMNELRDPRKRQRAIECSSHFWFATPVGLMKPEEVPDECGLIEFGKGPRGGWKGHKVVEAPRRRVECAPTRLVHGIAWRLRDLQHTLERRGIVV